MTSDPWMFYSNSSNHRPVYNYEWLTSIYTQVTEVGDGQDPP